MKHEFRKKRFSTSIKIKLSTKQTWETNTSSLLDSIIEIIEKYQDQGIRLTLRQLYYQLVAGGIIPNDDSVYRKLSTLLTDARYAGYVDWDAIEDRVRVPSIPSEWDNIPGLINTAIRSFRLPRWRNQRYYIELFTEKDALSSVLFPIAQQYHVPFCVNRGYSSATAMYDLFRRVADKIHDGKKIVIAYLGDHDPSGLDMIRDIEERLMEFLFSSGFTPKPVVRIIPIALNMEQKIYQFRFMEFCT